MGVGLINRSLVSLHYNGPLFTRDTHVRLTGPGDAHMRNSGPRGCCEWLKTECLTGMPDACSVRVMGVCDPDYTYILTAVYVDFMAVTLSPAAGRAVALMGGGRP